MNIRRAVSILVSVGLLALIYWRVDVWELWAVLTHSHAGWLMIALAIFIPTIGLTAWRLDLLMPERRMLGLGEATRLVLAASVLNMVLPSKMGDVAKAYFMSNRGHLPGAHAFALVVFEKTFDLLALLGWCAFGLIIMPHKAELFWTLLAIVLAGLMVGLVLLASPRLAHAGFGLLQRRDGRGAERVARLREGWRLMHADFWRRRGTLAAVVLLSGLIWFLHLLQIWTFIVALRASAPFAASLALSSFAILAGLMPFTFAGVGTRDAALIAFYAPYFGAATGGALGLLCTGRYVVPALLGVPLIGRYWRKLPAVESGTPPAPGGRAS